MKIRRLMILALVSTLILACNFPSFTSVYVNPTETAAPASAPTSPPASATPQTDVQVALITPTIPIAVPNGQPLNCRSGPGTAWPVVMVLNPGQSVDIVGKNPDGSWWYVKNPFLQGNFCWISTAYATASGDLGGIPLAAVPPTPVLPSPVPEPVKVTDVSVSVDPSNIHVGGCMGPIQQVTLNATITVNGAIKLQWHFETDQIGSLQIHSVNFKSAGSRDISDSFLPPVSAGKYQVQLFIEGMNLKGMNAVASYKISC